jgi:ATP-binding cassette, subfamily F, member 3
LVEGGRVRPFEGDMDDYRNHLLGGNSASQTRGGGDRGRDDSGNKKDGRRRAAERRSALGPLKKRLAEAEKQVAHCESERAKIRQSMADPKMYGKDVGRLLDLQKQLGGKNSQRCRKRMVDAAGGVGAVTGRRSRGFSRIGD